MVVTASHLTISDIINMLDRREMVINPNYQRNSGLWSLSAKSYFIDTILEQYTFPSIYIRQNLDPQKKIPIKEIVDGQQRISTIREFIRGELRLNKSSKRFVNMKYGDLSEEEKYQFSLYQVPLNLITLASDEDILELFRRINTFTTTLLPAEKRHASYQGKFKWFVNELTEKYSRVLLEYGVLTQKQILRMQDGELIVELCILLDKGMTNKSNAEFDKIYLKYNEEFPNENEWNSIFDDYFKYLQSHFTALASTSLMKSYNFHSLFAAMVCLKYGPLPLSEQLGIETIHNFCNNPSNSLVKLLEIDVANDVTDIAGKYGEYVRASSESTTKSKQRSIRAKILASILSNE